MERRDALEDAFTPGLNYEEGDTEYLSTTPERLMKTVESVLNMYELQRMKYMGSDPYASAKALKSRGGELTGSEVFTGMMREAASIPGAHVIEDLREVRYLIRKEFLTGGPIKGEEGELWMG